MTPRHRLGLLRKCFSHASSVLVLTEACPVTCFMSRVSCDLSRVSRLTSHVSTLSHSVASELLAREEEKRRCAIAQVTCQELYVRE